jgi:hypothetical protein
MIAFRQPTPAVQASVDRLYDQFPTMGVDELSQVLNASPAAIRKRAWQGRLPASIAMLKPLRWSTLTVVLWLQGVERDAGNGAAESPTVSVPKRGPGRPRKVPVGLAGGAR